MAPLMRFLRVRLYHLIGVSNLCFVLAVATTPRGGTTARSGAIPGWEATHHSRPRAVDCKERCSRRWEGDAATLVRPLSLVRSHAQSHWAGASQSPGVQPRLDG